MAGIRECTGEGLDQNVGMLALEDERRADLEHVGMLTGRADQHAAIAHAVDD